MGDWHEFFITSHDGLRLHARRLGPVTAPGLPVVCLPGIARTTQDFEDIAAVLAADGARAVYAFDYRGRGRSDRDPNFRNYDFAIELGDISDQLTALGIGEAIFFGTSRGGILTMLLAMTRPGAIAGAILNDIGPVIDGKGLARIKSYVGKLPQPSSIGEGAAILRRVSSSQFPLLDEAGWQKLARRTWRDDAGKLVPVYDPALLKTLDLIDLEAPLPTLWPQFEALAHVPVLVLRGEHSDILARATAEEMTRRHPDCTLWQVPGEGHAPLLDDTATQAVIRDFVARIAVHTPTI